MKKVLHSKNYQPFLIKCRDWQEIIKFYVLLEVNPMSELAKYIAENYSYGIYATTSMQTLCLAQTSEFELNKNVLRIDFTQNRFEFAYIAAGGAKNTGWKKTSSVDEGISTFEHILNRLRWIMK